jgi:MFS family permease
MPQLQHAGLEPLGPASPQKTTWAARLVGLFPAVLTGTPELIIETFLFFGLASANVFPSVLRSAAEMQPGQAGVNIADVNTVGLGGLLFGPPLVGYTAEHYSITHCMLLLAVVWTRNGFLLRLMLRWK